jgi:hypothetical protein
VLIVAIRDSLSDVATSDAGEDEGDEVTEQGTLNEDEQPSWVMGTIIKTVKHEMERFRQKLMKLDE